MEPDAAAQQESQEAAQKQEEEEEEDETDPAILAKKQKQLAKRGVTFEAKVDLKVTASQEAWKATRYMPCINEQGKSVVWHTIQGLSIAGIGA